MPANEQFVRRRENDGITRLTDRFQEVSFSTLLICFKNDQLDNSKIYENSYKPSPFFVLDEVDAALDNKNVAKLTNFIRTSHWNMQIIVVSLKKQFFCHADVLIGIAPSVCLLCFRF